jgi:hypothetical protein
VTDPREASGRASGSRHEPLDAPVGSDPSPASPDDLDTAEARRQGLDAVGRAFDEVKARTGISARGGVAAVVGGLILARLMRYLRLPRLRGRMLRRFGFGLLIVVMSVTTCSFGVDPSSLTAEYGAPVAASTEDAASVLNRGAQALQGVGETRSLEFTLTEAEATSVLSLGMMLPDLMQAAGRIPQEEIRSATDLEALRARVWEEAEEQRQEMMRSLSLPQRMAMRLDPRIRTGDVEVRFLESGEVVVAGYVQAWSFRQPAMFVVAPRAQAGELELDFVRGRLGRLPAPEIVFDLLGHALARAVLLGRDHAQVSELTVSEGRLRFAGRLGG